jgi:hypothetical protein
MKLLPGKLRGRMNIAPKLGEFSGRMGKRKANPPKTTKQSCGIAGTV